MYKIVKKTSERGQAIVLIALAIVGLFAFAALAIDGGMLYSARRHAQNTADTSAYASGLEIAESDRSHFHPSHITTIVNPGYARATSNGYDNNGATNGVAIQVTADTSGGHGSYPIEDDGMLYYIVEVDIWTTVDTAFAHLIFSGELKVSVHSEVRVRPEANILSGYAMYGASDSECGAITFGGTGDLLIDGGGIFSNSDGNGGSCCGFKTMGDTDVRVTDHGGNGIGSVGCYDSNGNGTVDPTPEWGKDPVNVPGLPELDCFDPGITNRGNFHGAGTLQPGRYGYIQITGLSTLEPGIYCITGSRGFKLTHGDLFGNGVMFYLEDGDFDLAGDEIILDAPTDLKIQGTQWAGMLIYMEYGNTGTVRIAGGGWATYTGTIYAPGPASPSSKDKCHFSGNSETVSMDSQIICYSLFLGGTGTLNIHYNEDKNFNLPPIIDLLQ